MRYAAWLSLTIVILVMTVLGVFYTGYEIIGAMGTVAMMITVWKVFISNLGYPRDPRLKRPGESKIYENRRDYHRGPY